ncbi:MAG TPA: 5-formyltetrahydrofolate cyclo-ligase [Cyclobacteriaceae bacterium]|jgi:5-formyltetrahydrofolate cyclo-ligase
MTKPELRRFYLKKRMSLTDDDYRQRSELLCARFFRSFDLKRIKVLHTFLPIIQNKEPDTWFIVNQLKEHFPAISISLPRINANGTMQSYFYERPDQLVTSPWGIPEPAEGIMTHPDQIDMVLVPLLAFDKEGHRVGYGKGHYDRFLSTCRKDCQKVGLSFFPPENKIMDIADTDLALSCVITPEKTYTF